MEWVREGKIILADSLWSRCDEKMKILEDHLMERVGKEKVRILTDQILVV